MEDWQVVSGYPNYSVSNFGSIRNDTTGRILKPYLRGRGYLSVKLSGKCFLVHRLVGLNFIPNENNYTQIDHIDRNKLNNNLSNLRWVTNSFNSRNRNKRVNQITTSKYKGVNFYKAKNKWVVGIRINGKRTHLGYFENENEAGIAYNNYIIENNLDGFVLNEIL
jgi:hypothetical protein